tara:strand:+ start:116 stop:277 length:162 start_codon:yes stop_codon:yes gene_type:complete
MRSVEEEEVLQATSRKITRTSNRIVRENRQGFIVLTSCYSHMRDQALHYGDNT